MVASPRLKRGPENETCGFPGLRAPNLEACNSPWRLERSARQEMLIPRCQRALSLPRTRRSIRPLAGEMAAGLAVTIPPTPMEFDHGLQLVPSYQRCHR